MRLMIQAGQGASHGRSASGSPAHDTSAGRQFWTEQPTQCSLLLSIMHADMQCALVHSATSAKQPAHGPLSPVASAVHARVHGAAAQHERPHRLNSSWKCSRCASAARSSMPPHDAAAAVATSAAGELSGPHPAAERARTLAPYSVPGCSGVATHCVTGACVVQASAPHSAGPPPPPAATGGAAAGRSQSSY